MGDNFTTNNFVKWFDKNYCLYLDYKAKIYSDDVLIYDGALYDVPHRMISLTTFKYVVGIYADIKEICIDIICTNIYNE